MKFKVLSLCLFSGALLMSGCGSDTDTTDPDTGTNKVVSPEVNSPNVVSFSGVVSGISADGTTMTVINGNSSQIVNIADAAIVTDGATPVVEVGMV